MSPPYAVAFNVSNWDWTAMLQSSCSSALDPISFRLAQHELRYRRISHAIALHGLLFMVTPTRHAWRQQQNGSACRRFSLSMQSQSNGHLSQGSMRPYRQGEMFVFRMADCSRVRHSLSLSLQAGECHEVIMTKDLTIVAERQHAALIAKRSSRVG